MRKTALLTAIVGLFCGAQVVAAADISYKDTPYETPLAPIWSGLYVGGHVGGLWSGDETIEKLSRCKDSGYCKCMGCYDTEWKKVDTKHFQTDKNDDIGLLGGLHLGYNWQDGDLVYGLEGDISFADNIDYLASLRARLGFVLDNFLIYATAGVAFIGYDESQLSVAGPWGTWDIGDAGSVSEVGLVIGGGAEYKLASNVSLGVEGLYYAFEDREDVYEWDKWCKEYLLTHGDDNDMFVIRARLSYHMQDSYEAPLK